MKLKVEKWLYALMEAFMGGGAGGVVSGLAAMGIAPDSFDLSKNLSKTLQMVGATFLISGVLNVVFLLKKSPLPEPENKEDLT